MRRITSLMLLLLLTCLPIWAQPQNYGDALITSADQLSSPFGDSQEGQHIEYLVDGDFGTFWHTDWHGEVQGDVHWLQVNLAEPVTGNLVIWMKRRAADNDHPSRIQVISGSDADFTTEEMIAEVEISNPSSGQEGVTPLIKLTKPLQYVRLAVVDCKGSSEGYRKFWHAAEVQFYAPSDDMIARQKLEDVFMKYDMYMYEDFDYGTDYGQVTDRETGDLFREKLAAVDKMLQDENYPSPEEIELIAAELDSLYECVWNSENLFQLEQKGYYRIIANKDYYKTIETGEVDEDGNAITEKVTGIVKSLYGKLEGLGGWHTYDKEDCRDVWYLEQNADSSITMYNAATEMGFAELGSPVTMREELDSCLKMRFDFAGRDPETGRVVLYIRNNETPRDKTLAQSVYLHQLGHGQGANDNGNLCLWRGTFQNAAIAEGDWGTSEWYLEPVSDEEAQALIEAYAPVKNHDLLVLQYQEVLADAHAALTISKETNDKALITSNDQFASKVTESSEGSLNNLLDGNSSTFWHSAWKPGNRPMGTHFLDVILPEPTEGVMNIWMQRRGTATNDDNPTLWNIYGSNDEAALESVADFENTTDEAELRAQTVEGWTLITEGLETPWTSGVVPVKSANFTVPEPYKYFRFVCTQTRGGSYNDRGYFHIGDFQLYLANLITQFSKMGEVGTKLDELVAYGDSLDTDELTIDDLRALESALEAFRAILIDPTELRQLLRSESGTTGILAIGDEPGYWSSDAEANALDAILAEADAYDKAGEYTQEQVDKYVAGITAAAEAFKTAFNTVDPGIWYRIQFPEEEIYDDNGWGKGNCSAIETNAMGALFGQYASVGTLISDVELPYIQLTENDAIREGAAMHFTTLDEIGEDNDAALFRFISVGDTAYIMQNKATGLFISCAAASSNDVTLGLNPTLFKIGVTGKGGVAMHGYALDGTDRTGLHAQKDNHRLVTWGDYSMGSNTGLHLVSAAAVEEADLSFYRDVQLGEVKAQCYPVALEATEGTLLEVVGTYTNDEGNWVALNTIERTKAGIPFIYLYGEIGDYTPVEEGEEAVTDPFLFKAVADEVVAAADSINGMVGTYAAKTVEAGTVVFVGGGAEGAKPADSAAGTASTLTVPANGAYLNFGLAPVDAAGSYDLVIKIDGEIVDGIQTVLNKVAQRGKVYSIDGKLVRENATLKDLKGLGTGVYILNGVKVRVK